MRILRKIAVWLSLFLILPISLYLAYKFGGIFKESSSIGDFIGGVLNPIIAIFSAFLVYLTLVAQTKANKIQIDSLDEEKLERKEKEENAEFERRLNDISQLIRDLEYDKTDDDRIKGIRVMYFYPVDIVNHSIPDPSTGVNELLLDQIRYISYSCQELTKTILSMKTNGKVISFERFKMFFDGFLSKGIFTIISSLTSSDSQMKKHLIDIIIEIEKHFNNTNNNLKMILNQIGQSK